MLSSPIPRLIVDAESATLHDIEHTSCSFARARRSVDTFLPFRACHDTGVATHVTTRGQHGNLVDRNLVAIAARAMDSRWGIGLLLKVTDDGEVP